MQRFYIYIFIILTVLLPGYASAMSQNELLIEIERLEAQILELQALIAGGEVGSEDDYTELNIYDGPYAAVYQVDSGSRLSLVFGDTSERSEHEEIWDLFVAIADSDFVDEYVAEFRVFDDGFVSYSGFVEELDDDEWVLGINLFDVDLDNPYGRIDAEELLVHEYSHILFANNPDIEDEFVETFWDGADWRHAIKVDASNDYDAWNLMELYYSRNTDEFVSPYATSNPVEDMAETFTFFALDWQPEGDGEVEEKIDFMFEFDDFTDARERIQSVVQ